MMHRFLTAAALLVLTAQPVAAKNNAELLLRHATLVDVEHARTVGDQAIATRGGQIVAVGERCGRRSPLARPQQH